MKLTAMGLWLTGFALFCWDSTSLGGECGCQSRQAGPSCYQSAPAETCRCRHRCHHCDYHRPLPQGPVVSSMPAMMVAPLAIAQPSSFLTVQSQPTLNFSLRPSEPSSLTAADVSRALQMLAEQAKSSPQQAPPSCNKSHGAFNQPFQAPPVPPGDTELTDRVQALENRLNGLETRIEDSFARTNQTLERVLEAVKK